MSIFKATFKPYICRQINARQDLVSFGESRPIELHQFTAAKTPWVKMVSFVNYDSPDKKYSGDKLARKYVLSAGTLSPGADPNSFSLRKGVGKANAVYGNNLGDNNYGLVPMPGITSVNIKSKSAYGSLREATVKFLCWDKTQLDELEILFMRPGYTVLLEWGWSMYLDTSVANESYDADTNNGNVNNRIDLSKKLLFKSFDQPTINPFDPGVDQEKIYDSIARLQHKFSGNYDACLGKIMNFSWQLLPNGGFECTTVLISIGDVLDTLKINSGTGIERGSVDSDIHYQTEFEKLMNRLVMGNKRDRFST